LTTLLLLSSPLVFAAPAGPTSASRDAATHVAQARLSIKKGWWEDAARELDLALAAPDGPRSFEAHWLRAKVAWELVDYDTVLRMATAAQPLAPDEDKRGEAAQLATLCQSSMGVVVLSGPRGQSAVKLGLPAVIFDPELKRYAERAAERLGKGADFPLRLGLPAGSYTVNGVAVEVAAGAQSTVEVAGKPIVKAETPNPTRFEVAGGVELLGESDATFTLAPATLTEIGLTHPVGPLIVGLSGELRWASYLSDGGTLYRAPLAGGGGLRVGVDLLPDGPLTVRVAGALRVGPQDGLRLDCDPTTACSGETRGLAVVPGLELSADHRPVSGERLGMGLRVGVDEHLFLGEGSAPGFRVLSNLTYAL
jgi:hypothetical protein